MLLNYSSNKSTYTYLSERRTNPWLYSNANAIFNVLSEVFTICTQWQHWELCDRKVSISIGLSLELHVHLIWVWVDQESNIGSIIFRACEKNVAARNILIERGSFTSFLEPGNRGILSWIRKFCSTFLEIIFQLFSSNVTCSFYFIHYIFMPTKKENSHNSRWPIEPGTTLPPYLLSLVLLNEHSHWSCLREQPYT